MTAYSPLGTPPSSAMFKDYQPDLVMNDPVVKDMAKKYNKNVGQVHSSHSLQIQALMMLKVAVRIGYISVASTSFHCQTEALSCAS